MDGLETTRIGTSGAGRPDGDRANLERLTAEDLAREFESVMLLQMLRQMRQTALIGESEGGSYASAILDTIDVELARHLSRAGGVGISDAMAGVLTRQTVPDTAPPTASPTPLAATPATAPAPPARTAEAEGMTAHLTSPFGWRADPFTGAQRFHGGIDIRAAYGESVPAAAGGVVVEAGERGAFGLTVVIEHDSGVRTRYAHLSAMAVTGGERVDRGQEIGRVGQSGRATGPHLHFEVVRDGQRIDPEGALTALGEGLAGLKLAGRYADYRSDRRTSPADGADDES